MTLLKKRRNNQQNSTSDLPAEEISEESTVFKEEPLDQLYRAIHQLSEVDRAVILLYLEEKSYKEIADIIGTNSNNIGVRIKRIKKRLKRILDGKVN